jgi:NADH:ubiquinone oxidoreductase subunit H
MTFFFLLILLGIYVFKFAAIASVKRSPFEATFLNGMDMTRNKSVSYSALRVSKIFVISK